MMRMNKLVLLNIYCFTIISLMLFTSCTKEAEIKKENLLNNNSIYKIVLSKGSGSKSYENYGRWLRQNSDDSLEIIDLYHKSFEEAKKYIAECDGVVLTGGPDVHPGRFDKAYDTTRCSIDLKRDTLEFALINLALEKKLPILGICRGMQILNVALKGDLIVDIPEDIGNNVIHQIDEGDAEHKITIIKDSYFNELTKLDDGIVNSNHHQAIGKLSDDLIASSFTNDSLPESIEWKNKENKSWLLAVQWHPERLAAHHPLSETIVREFLRQVMQKNQKTITN